MSVLKRLKPTCLRHQVPKGKRVLIVYDRAGIDLAYWKRCQRECAVYFISRVKEKMVFSWISDFEVDRQDLIQMCFHDGRNNVNHYEPLDPFESA